MRCRACGKSHDSWIRCEVAAAQSGEVDPLRGEVPVRVRLEVGLEKTSKTVGVSLGPTANRRTREAYNAYMKEYMKARRLRQRKGKKV